MDKVAQTPRPEVAQSQSFLVGVFSLSQQML